MRCLGSLGGGALLPTWFLVLLVWGEVKITLVDGFWSEIQVSASLIGITSIVWFVRWRHPSERFRFSSTIIGLPNQIADFFSSDSHFDGISPDLSTVGILLTHLVHHHGSHRRSIPIRLGSSRCGFRDFFHQWILVNSRHGCPWEVQRWIPQLVRCARLPQECWRVQSCSTISSELSRRSAFLPGPAPIGWTQVSHRECSRIMFLLPWIHLVPKGVLRSLPWCQDGPTQEGRTNQVHWSFHFALFYRSLGL